MMLEPYLLMIVAAGVTGILTYCDLDAVFDAPPNSLGKWERIQLYLWLWGFILVNAGLSIVLYLIVREQGVFGKWNPWILALVCGAGYTAIVRLKITTLEYNGQKTPLGLETLYEAIKSVVHRRINAVIRAWRQERCIALSQSTLEVLHTQAIITMGSDALLTDQQRTETREWINSTVADASPEEIRKATLALYIITMRRFV